VRSALIEAGLAAAENAAGPWPKAKLSGWISWRRILLPQLSVGAADRPPRFGAVSPNTDQHGGEHGQGQNRPAAARSGGQ